MDDTPRVRVRIVESYGVLGGAQGWLLRLLEATDALDVDVVLLSDGELVPALADRGIPTRVRPTGKHPHQLAATAAWLARDLRRHPVEVVLGNSMKAAMVAVPGRWLARTPVVWAKHDHVFDDSLARPLGRRVDRVVAAVEELAEAARRPDTVIVPPPRPERPPAGRDEAREFWRARLDLDAGPVAAMATRLVAFKGVDDAIAGIARTAEWRLAVIGDEDPSAPGELERLRSIAAEHAVEDRVTFLGYVPATAHWLAAFDALLVLTKLDHRGEGKEGFGTAAFEAMLAGVPVVAVEGGAVVRRLEERAGYGVPVDDPVAVAAALERLADPAARQRMGAAAREIVADHPTAEECARRLVAVLRETRDRAGRGARR